ncbi:serine/threonine-protein phosphatase 6 regulatory ankyrin repeat subunit B-like [Microcaecilia unicolor]|uniref:Serine/threonine-protein phosphatase 6 regulatory ankyrin repeat subunit B-like n=1 Tax=Microcaecilia unicolor TaxID=1415580 RepID=A0A6P7X6R9_9AMPH|nr:serine/threonine-protein phosphatase 6 regulatory ankyrin repeat subunit B-like [Microcaecilia unicolor]
MTFPSQRQNHSTCCQGFKPEMLDGSLDGRTVLHVAAAHSKEEIVRMLLARKADPNVAGGPKDQLPLHYAALRPNGGIGVTQVLLKTSHKDTRLKQNKDGCIPLFLAVESGNIGICKELLSAQVEAQLRAQRKKYGDTVLHASCRKRDPELVKLLVEYGAIVDFQNEEGHTPMHVVAWEGDEVLLKFFYQCKANPNITDKLDRSPLHVSAERGHTNIVEVLTEKFHSNVLARTKDGSTLMHIASQHGHPDTALAFLKKGVLLHMPNKTGALCLHAAAKQGHAAVVKALLQKGARVDARTKDNYTALHIAAQHCRPLVVQTLLGFGAQVQLKGGKAQETPLHIAARIQEGEKVAEMLLKSGADVNVEQENGETAMHIAARHGNLKMITALIEEGGELIWQSKAGESPLHIAVQHCHLPVVEEILSFLVNEKSHLETTACVNQQNKEGETPLHLAAAVMKTMIHLEEEDSKIIRILMEYDADISIPSKQMCETPLHYCARVGNADVLLEILKHISSNRMQQTINNQAKNGWSPLLVAAERGHTETVKILLQNHARVDVFDEQGKAALHLAAENGHDQIVDVLLWHKAFVNAKTKLGLTPLHLSAQNGFNRLVKLLVETHLASIDAMSLIKQTPLHLAALNGQLDVCNSLLNMKADVDATDIQGQTPLHLAAENDHSDVVKLFLKHKPELVTSANVEGSTCAHIAAAKGSVAVIKEFLKFNKVGVTSTRNKTNDSTPLHLAASGGHAEVVKVLLEAGASASDENGEGMTAIHLAAKNGHINVLESLKNSISFRIPSSKTGFTALHVAAQFGQVDFIREILTGVSATMCSEPPKPSSEAQHSKEHTSESGYTPLHLAAQSGHESLVRILLNYPGVQVDSPTNLQGSIPLHLAAQNGHTVVIGLLLSKSTSQLHLKDKRGQTCLHLAAANGHIETMRALLGQGAEINVTDKNGWSPLHFAAQSGFLDTVQFLIESGASPTLECKEGRMPIQYAAGENYQEVVSFLLRKNNNTLRLIEDRKFILDLMICGKLKNNKAIEEFVLHSTAPLDTAIKLSQAFSVAALREKERAMDLINAAKYSECMATELLSMALGSKSAGCLLRAVDHRGTTMLDCLIECEQKDVVAHPAVQKYLSDIWYGSLQWAPWKIVLLFFSFLMCPLVWLVFSLPLKHGFNKIPIMKFMTHLASHIFLLVLFILTVVYPPLSPVYEGHMTPGWNEWLLLAWLSGTLVSEFTHPGERVGLAWIRLFVLGFSAVAFFCHLLAFLFMDTDRLHCLFARNIFLGVAMTLSFVQFLEFLTFHHLFGPWAIIIRDLIKDLTRFAVILGLFHVAFTMQLSAVYQPVYPEPKMNQSIVNENGTAKNDYPIQDPVDITVVLFFSLFGLIDPECLPPLNRTPHFTFVIVRFVFGVYLVVTLIVLINLLIAMMSDTYQRIQAHSDTEWKFGRAILIRDMTRKSGTPSPFNLCTNLFYYIKIFCKYKGKLCTTRGQDLMNEEENMDGVSDTRSVDLLAPTSMGWIRTTTKRSTQVSPKGSLLFFNLLQLEFVINYQKSHLHPYQQLEFIEALLDMTHASTFLPAQQIEAVTTMVQEVHQSQQIPFKYLKGGFFQGPRPPGPVHIDEIIDWHTVVLRYLSLKGQTDGTLYEKEPAQHVETTASHSFQLVTTTLPNGSS